MAGHIFKVSLPNPFMKSIRNLCGGTVQLIFIEKEEEEEKGEEEEGITGTLCTIFTAFL